MVLPKGMHQPTGLQTSLGEGLAGIMPVHVVEEDVIALVATAHHVIQGAGVSDSHFARQDAQALAEPTPQVKRG